MKFAWMLGAVILLAGCASPPAEPTTDEGFEDLSATEDTGVVRGVVVDETVQPVAGVTATLMAGTEEIASTQGDDEGRFGLSNVEPGFHQLRISAPGWFATEVQISVEAGVDNPPLVKVVLARIPVDQFYVNQLLFQGYLECSVTAGASANLCFIVNYYPNLAVPVGQITDESSSVEWVDEFVSQNRAPTWTQLETAWESSQNFGDALSHRYETDTDETTFIDCVIGSASGLSPVVFAFNYTAALDAGLGAYGPPDEEGCDIQEPLGLTIETFSTTGQYPVGAAVSQDFELFANVFYGYEPPEGWTFVEDGAPPGPQ